MNVHETIWLIFTCIIVLSNYYSEQIRINVIKNINFIITT